MMQSGQSSSPSCPRTRASRICGREDRVEARNPTASVGHELLQQLDYVLMDADTVPLGDGTYLPIWRHDLFIDDMGAFLDLYMDYIVQILSSEPIQIFGRPTYLPINFARHHGEVWTRKRNIALEIQENIRLPTVEFIELAKRVGCRFTFGTNARNYNAGNLGYYLEVARRCGLTEDDFLVVK